MGLLNNVSTGRKLAALSGAGLLRGGVIGTVAYLDVREIKGHNRRETWTSWRPASATERGGARVQGAVRAQARGSC